MKTTIVLFVTGILLTCSCQSQPVKCDVQHLNEQLSKMYARDQDLRKELMPLLAAYQEDSTGKMKFIMHVMKMNKADKKNQQQLDKILKKCGWPAELNEKANSAIFLVLQHAPTEMMQKYFPLITEKTGQGVVDSSSWATMHDRLQMRAGEKQLYGSQTFSDTNNRNQVWPIEDIDNLEERRRKMGLPPMEEYISIALDSMDVRIVWDRDMTLEEAEKLSPDQRKEK